MTARAISVVIGCVLALVANASTPDSEVINLRALGPHVAPEIVRYVARHAKRFPPQVPPSPATEPFTPRSVITRLCGSLRIDDYYNEFIEANKPLVLPPDQPIPNDQVAAIKWPACLYVEVPARSTEEVGVDESASRMYARLTGGGGGEPALKRYFKRLTDQGVDLAKLQPRQKIEVPYVTRSVAAIPEEKDPDEFWQDLLRTLGEAKLRTMLRRIDGDMGEIVAATDDPAECKSTAAPPFDPVALFTAYKFARGMAMASGAALRTADVVVIDNGFFGADPRRGLGKEFDGSPFPAKYFASERGSVVAKRFDLVKKIFPINYQNSIAPDYISGHGTHVAGLVMGGPDWRPYWPLVRPDGLPWLRITVFNAGAGSASLIRGIHYVMAQALTYQATTKIVNMSIAYEGASATEVATTFDGLFRHELGHLYVVAAGNQGRSVASEVYPAGKGGLNSENVVAVAALDSEQRLTQFSNIGRKTVDMAAPGCQIRSWIRDNADETALNGTSQAAPLVSFAASLLYSITDKPQPRDMKNRLVVSGDLLDPKDQDELAYKVKLNIPKALLAFHDYVRTAAPDSQTLLGTVDDIAGLHCIDKDPGPLRLSRLWALKRGTRSYAFTGRADHRLEEPCTPEIRAPNRLQFSAAYRISPAGEIVADTRTVDVPLDSVDEIIMRAR